MKGRRFYYIPGDSLGRETPEGAGGEWEGLRSRGRGGERLHSEKQGASVGAKLVLG